MVSKVTKQKVNSFFKIETSQGKFKTNLNFLC